MNLVRYNPGRRLSRTYPNGANFFDSFFDDLATPLFVHKDNLATRKVGNLKVDIYEKEDSIFIEAELPGVAKEDISVDAKGRVITLAGERKSKKEEEGTNCFRKERFYGKFERSFTLPFEIQSENVKASFNNGILELEISKPEEQAIKKITIN